MAHRFYENVKQNQDRVGHCICIGLDPSIEALPPRYTKDVSGVREFLKDYIIATQDLCVAYKANISFYEGMGIAGLKILESLRDWIPKTVPYIIDAKRGDIGNTSKMQAKYIFDYFGADATTLHPYMGGDSVAPFIDYQDKFHFILGVTSNAGAKDFEYQKLDNGGCLYEAVIAHAIEWGKRYHNIGIVVGATQKEQLLHVRKIAHNLLFLVPGVGAQGACYRATESDIKNTDGLGLINVSRGLMLGLVGDDLKSEIKTRIVDILNH